MPKKHVYIKYENHHYCFNFKKARRGLLLLIWKIIDKYIIEILYKLHIDTYGYKLIYSYQGKREASLPNQNKQPNRRKEVKNESYGKRQ